jgi:hypothetical protein
MAFSSAHADGVNYSAYVVYGENIQYPMPGVVANLYNANGVFVASSITNIEGIFAFSNLTAGENYSVHFTTDLDPCGVNLADAYLLLNYLNGHAELTELQLKAADVNGDTKVNYTDFSFIVSQWYIHGEDFPAGEWVLPVWTFTASGFKSTADLGPDGPITIVSQSDISGDLPPVIKKIKNVINISKEYVFTENKTELTIPVSFAEAQDIKGLGLEMAFDSKNIEIIEISSKLNDIAYNINGNSVKLSWVSALSANYTADQSFLNLKVRFDNTQNIESALSLLSEAQFVDAEGKLIENVQLNMPALKKAISGLEVGNMYPNPGNNEVNFTLNQAFAANVQVEIYNLSGQLVKQIEVMPRNSKVTISTGDLPNGSYLCAIKMDATREVKLFSVQH